jgi:hypothetical protein
MQPENPVGAFLLQNTTTIRAKAPQTHLESKTPVEQPFPEVQQSHPSNWVEMSALKSRSERRYES